MNKVNIISRKSQNRFGRFTKIMSKAHLAELVDALVLGTSDFGRGSSSLPVGIPKPFEIKPLQVLID